MSDELRLDIGLALFFTIIVLASWINIKAKEKLLPPPDRSVKRGAEIADEMNRYSSKIKRQN